MVEDQTKSPASVCLTCGDEGYKESLWSCNECQISAEHGYCLARMPDPDDEEFTYTCAQCISSSTKPSLLDALRPRLSQKKKHRRHLFDVPVSLVQDMKRGFTKSSPLSIDQPATLAQDQVKMEADKDYSSLCGINQDDALVQDMKRGLTNSSPCSIDQPATLAQDQVKREADKDYSTLCGINQADALVQDMENRQEMDVLQQAGANKNRSACRIDKPDVLVGDVEKRQTKGSPLPELERVQTHGVSPLQTSVLGPSSSNQHCCGDQVLKRCRSFSHEDLNRSDNDQVLKRRSLIRDSLLKSNKDVEGKEYQVVAFGHSDSRIDEIDALVEDMDKRQAKGCSPIPEVETVQTHSVSPLQASVLGPTKSSQHCCGDQVLKRSKSILHEDLNRSDNDEVLKRRSFSSDSLNKPDKDVEGKESQVVAFGHLDNRIDEPDKDVGRKHSQVVVFGQVDSVARGGQLEISSPRPFFEYPHFDYAQPIADPTWRGCIEFTKGSYDFSRKKFGRVKAHISSVACLDVHKAAKLMPAVLCAKMMPRLETWPTSFKISTPTDKNIALYFFPESDSVVKSYDGLLNCLNTYDYAVKIWLDNAELLLFSSNQMPPRYWRFNGKYYLWGVFRGDGHVKQSGDIGNMHDSTMEIKKQSDSSEFPQKSPLSPLSMNGSYGSDSPRSPLPPTSKYFSSEMRSKILSG